MAANDWLWFVESAGTSGSRRPPTVIFPSSALYAAICNCCYLQQVNYGVHFIFRGKQKYIPQLKCAD